MIVKTKDESVTVIYQKWQDDFDMAGEPALIVTKYESEIQIESENSSININFSTVPDLIKTLKEYTKK